MPRYIVKPRPSEDFYVIYSTVVDAPVVWGTREDMLTDEDTDESRMNRTDTYGSSTLWPSTQNPYMGWNSQQHFQIREGIHPDYLPDGAWACYVDRDNLRALCETAEDDGRFKPTDEMVEYWYYFEDS